MGVNAENKMDGWQSDYPAWHELITAASHTMRQSDPSPQMIKDVAFCWAISEEDEPLADYAKTHMQECWPILYHLVRSPYPETRWQVYDALSVAGSIAEDLLREGLTDL